VPETHGIVGNTSSPRRAFGSSKIPLSFNETQIFEDLKSALHHVEPATEAGTSGNIIGKGSARRDGSEHRSVVRRVSNSFLLFDEIG
jgi:hypothetical protein